jgi:hypothetical protein
MAQQIKKKFIGADQVDGSKIKLQKDQAVRGQKQDGSEVELLKLDGSDKLVHDGQEIAFKSQLDSEEQARIAGDQQLQSNLDQEVSDLEASILVEKTRAEGEESRIESKFDGMISAEQSARESADNDLSDRIDEEELRASQEENRIEAKFDEMMSDEQSAREQGDSSLQSQIDTEKSRVDAILLASQADKDSFAEIVELINSVDTENDSAFASYVLSNNAALAQEVSDRQAGDQSLQSEIEAEETRAMGEESRIESKFDGMMSTETAARIAGDSALQSSLAQEVSDRQAAVSAEQSAREQADSDLQDSIDAEESRAMGVESSLQSQITQEVSDRQSAVSAEASARQSADSVLQSNINSEASARQSADTTLQSNIDAEETRAMGVEAELQSDLENLDGYAQDIRSDLDQEILDRQSAVSSEETARIAGDSALQSSLNSEISARQSADTTLQSNIDAEVSARLAGDADIELMVEEEISNRESEITRVENLLADERNERGEGDASTLQSSKDYTDGKISLVMSNLDTEALDSLVEVVTAFQNADSDLNQSISDLSAAATSALATETAARISGDSSLQSDSDALEGVVQGNFDLQQSDIDGLRSDIDAEVINREAAISAEQSARELADQQLQSNIDGKVSKSGDSMTGDYSMTGWFNFSNSEDSTQVSSLGFGNLAFTSGNSGTDVSAGSIMIMENGVAAIPLDPRQVTTKAYVDQLVTSTSDQLSEVIDNEVSSILEQLSQEVSDRQAADESLSQQLGMHIEDYNSFRDDTITDIGNLSSRITALEVQTDGPYFNKMKFVIDESSELSSVELAHECVENSLVVCVGRLMVHKDEDFSVSVVNGKTVLTWMGDFATGGVEAIEEGDVIFVTYAREV